MANDIQRVNYAEGQRLSAADLLSEQMYLLGLDARHNLGEHVPGVALGLMSSSDVTGDPVISPGVAIDAQGRELLSSASTPVPVLPAGAACVDLWIVYCLVPLRLRQPGLSDCSPGAFQRWREFGQIVANGANAGDAPAAPFNGAVYLGRVRCDSSTDVSFVALMGQRVADPGNRSILQVGPVNDRDTNGFMVQSTDGTGVFTPRLAIDRFNKTSFWGDLNLQGYFASALLATPVDQAFLLVQAKKPGDAGEQIRVRLTPSRMAGGKQVFNVTFLVAGKSVGTPFIIGPDLDNIKNQISAFDKTSSLVSLSLVVRDQAPDQREDPALNAASPIDQVLTGQDDPLDASGGDLKLQQWPDPPVQSSTRVRGCAPPASTDPPDQLPNGISFTPPAQPVKRTPLPGASAATITENGNSVLQLRLDLGLKKDNDPSTRLSMGAPDSTGKFAAWLTGDGNGKLAINGGGASANPSLNLNVTGTIQQAPIQPDATDPRFANLLVLAWLHGLQSSVQASTVVQLSIPAPPVLIETGQPWSYTVSATNSGLAAVTADKLFETRSIGGQTLLTNVANQTVIPPGPPSVFTIQHVAGDMGTTGDLSIEVRMSGKIGNIFWWKPVTAGPIPVVPSPPLDSTDLPSSTPPGADFDYSFSIKNTAARAIHLTAVTVTEAALALPQPVPPGDMQQGDTNSFGPITHPGGINADLTVKISISFDWHNGPSSSVTATKTIRSLTDLKIQFQMVPASISVGAAWTYKLQLTNSGAQPLVLQTLEQRLSSVDFPTTAYASIPLGGSIHLNPGESQPVGSIAGTLVPAATTKVTLEIRSTYLREGRTWTPQTVTEVINVT